MSDDVVTVLPNGDQVAFGEHAPAGERRPVIWIKRSDPRWEVAEARYRKERKVTPRPHMSKYFAGYGYAFPISYFGIAER